MELDTTLLSTFTEALHECRITSPDNIVSEVHSSLLNKVYNARCNEFLQTVCKLSCIDKNQAVDASVGLKNVLSHNSNNVHVHASHTSNTVCIECLMKYNIILHTFK